MGWGKFLGLISLLYSTQWVKFRGQGGLEANGFSG